MMEKKPSHSPVGLSLTRVPGKKAIVAAGLLTTVLVIVWGILCYSGLFGEISQPEVLVAAAIADAQVYVSPRFVDGYPGQEFSVDLVVKTDNKVIVGIDIRVEFDPDVVEFLGAEKGSVVELPCFPALGRVSEGRYIDISAVNYDPETGSYTSGYEADGPGGNLARLRFKVKNDSSPGTKTELKVIPKTADTWGTNAVEKDTGENIVSQVEGTMVTIKRLPTPTPSPIYEATPSLNRIKMEAENGQLTEETIIGKNPKASGGKYIQFGSKGSAIYSFPTGNKSYYFWVKYRAQDGRSNSFYLTVDGGKTIYTVHLPVTGKKWRWKKLWLRRSAFSATDQIKFSSGKQEMRLLKRERNLMIDKIILSSNRAFTPN